MNKIYLDKLIDYCHLTYKNNLGVYEQNLKKINLSEEIKKIKYNTSLNEKGVSLKYNFVDLSNIFNNIEYNEMVLISPISFNIDEIEEINPVISKEWYSFLNALLLIFHGSYLNQNNNTKKEILERANKMYLKKLKKVDVINSDVLNSISVFTSINIIIISNIKNEFNIEIYDEGKKQKSADKMVILVKCDNEYYPVYNFENKNYQEGDIFIEYLKNMYLTKLNDKKQLEIEDKLEEIGKDSKDKDIKDKDVKDIKDKDIKDKDIKDKDIKESKDKKKNDELYQEVQTVEDYTLYVSEAVENEPKSKPKNTKKNVENTSDNKKKKNNKDIFIKEELEIKEKVTDSVFNKTELIDIDSLKEKYQNIKATTKLDEIQGIALKINIAITNGSTKDGKPKNKTKSELLEDLKIFFEN